MSGLREVRLEDRYLLERGEVLMTGIQALVRLPLDQRRRDARAGHRTAGYITGYRGSPLGTYDLQLQRARELLAAHDIVHQPGVNEDLAATACQGTQQVALFGENRYDGVFAIWYGKGPGVDRSGDAIRHGNLFGTHPLGGVLLLLGDDHLCESSTTAHQSEFAMVDAMVPVLNPAGVQEILEFGLYGIALSRFSGAWVSLKCVHDTVESTAVVRVDPERPAISLPEDWTPPPEGLHIRWPDHGIGPSMALAQERRLHVHKLEAARAFARANGLDRLVTDPEPARLLVVSTGKSWLDLVAALDLLGLSFADLARMGVRLYKVGMTFPLEPTGLERAVRGVERVLVVEEKRPLVEDQMRVLLYDHPVRPLIEGKRDRFGRPLFPSHGALSIDRIAVELGRRLVEAGMAGEELARRVEALERLGADEADYVPPAQRLPWFCPGCPHNTSTRVPEGSRAVAGIGCHFMAQWMDRSTATFTQMGGEGASWLGQFPFVHREHVFQNVGDGTFYHSGSLAVRAAVAAGANITFKILYNDAVAMTGGQKMEIGNLAVPQIAQLLAAEGVKEIAVVADDPRRYPIGIEWPRGVRVHPREELAAVQERLRRTPGVTAIIYDQTCAAEKRRRRKRGEYPDPPLRLFIHEEVCEGCGDCARRSNCVAVVPVETPFGTKRRIDQSACNKDWSCLEGFCPSFVTVVGGRPRSAAPPELPALDALPEPELPALERPMGIVVTGIGGTGVITVAALLAMAAHLERRGATGLDMIGLAQKGGAVVSFLKIGPDMETIGAPRVATGGADVILGCDLVVTAGRVALPTAARGRTRAVVNEAEIPTGEATRIADFHLPIARLKRVLTERMGEEAVDFVDATGLARRLLGDAIGANLFLVGRAYQRGLLPVSAAAIERAIELNGVAVEFNRRAFRLGRLSVVDPELVARLARPEREEPIPHTLDEIVEHRARHLEAWQDRAWAQRYRDFVEHVRRVEAERTGSEELARTVALALARLMSYKDEYEVARLFSDPSFERRLRETFEGVERIEYHLAPPLFASRDPETGHLRKARYGPWMRHAFRLLAKLRFLRGTPLDIFGSTAERRRERALIGEYRALVERLLERLTPGNHALAVEIAGLALAIRGYGHVKEAAIADWEAKTAALLARYEGRVELAVAAE